MRPKERLLKTNSIIGILIVVGILSGCSKKSVDEIVFVKPSVKDVRVTVSVSGTVIPKNRLEVKPPLGGRVEKVYVSEGDYVRSGQTIAQMSSGERAAILDTARAQGSSNLRYWETVYKPILIVSPMNGTVIVRNIEPGQTISAADTAIVISDRLIAQALIDETDIGQIHSGMPAVITLDAYPDIQIKGSVGHISYESTTVNNVTMYKAEIIPENVPGFVRSGMSSSIEIIVSSRDNVMTIPNKAVKRGERGTAVMIKIAEGERPDFRPVKLGPVIGSDVEIISGLSTNDTVMIFERKLTKKSKRKETTNPFMPQRPRGRQRSSPPPPPSGG